MAETAVATHSREEWVNVTRAVQDIVAESGMKEGVCVASVPHTTAAIAIQENADPDVVSDCLMALDRMVPADLPFRHSEGNSTAHVKTVLTGSSVTLPVRGGKLALGTWQGIYFCEYDGPRRRRMLVDLIASAG